MTVSGESKSVASEMADGQWETSLLTLLSNCELKDIFNACEFGLFYECPPNKTYQRKSEKSYGRKLSKIGIAGLAVANVIKDKLLVFGIGKDKIPWCFKNVKLQKSTKNVDEVLFDE